jgi:hypothetical protein
MNSARFASSFCGAILKNRNQGFSTASRSLEANGLIVRVIGLSATCLMAHEPARWESGRYHRSSNDSWGVDNLISFSLTRITKGNPI